MTAGLLLLVMLTVGGVVTDVTLAVPSTQDALNNLSPDESILLLKLRQAGRLRVVIGANVLVLPESQLSDGQAVQGQRAAIVSAQSTVLSLLGGTTYTFHSQLRTLPYFTVTVDEAAFLRLAVSPNVASIEEDQVFTVELAEAIPLINADDAWAAGYTGSGQAVAILDSGTDKTHPFFGGRVKSEACYSLADAPSGMTSACPNGQQSQTGSGAAAPPTSAANPPIYAATDPEGQLWSHGTHVAGIAAGSGQNFSGVAKAADIIAIQVGSEGSPEFCTEVYGMGFFPIQTCPLIPYSNILSALERVYFLRDTYSIAAVNMSFGRGNFSGYCDDFFPAITDAIDQLASVGIATVAATGNAGYTDSISFPGCISTTVAVGASTKADGVADFSNSASTVDVLAPGAQINSSVIGGGFGVYDGTSMATPMVTGAYAVIRSAKNDATLENILAALQSTGHPITDSRNSVIKPRIDVKAGADAVKAGFKAVRKVVINEIKVEGNAAVELFNADSRSANLNGWKLQMVSPTGTQTQYTFPNFTLNSGAYVVVREGSGVNTATELFMNGIDPGWTVDVGGAARLTNTVIAIDFVRWDNSTADPGIGTAFVETNPPGPLVGENIGRDEFSTDYDTGLDWTAMGRTLGGVNDVIRPPNDAPNNATNLASLPFSQTLNIRNATKVGEPTLACAPDTNHTVWYRYQSAAGGKVTFQTTGTEFDSVLAIFTGIDSTPSMVGCNDDITPGENIAARLTLNAQPNVVYHIVAGANGGYGGLLTISAFEGEFNDEIDTAKVITSLPYQDVMDVSEATTTEADPVAACQMILDILPIYIGDTVWYRYTPASTITTVFNLTGTNFTWVVTTWKGSPGNLTPVGCHAPDLDVTQPELALTGGTTYYFVVTRVDFLAPNGNTLSFKLKQKGAPDPTPEPTSEPTLEPTPEPTATPDPADNLVVNGGFDEQGGSAKDADSWKPNTPRGDKRVCNPANPNFAKSAPCVFEFTGNPGTTSSIVQKFPPDGVNPGDTLMLRFWAKAMKLKGAAQVQLQGRYLDSTKPTKRVIKIPLGNTPYTEFADVMLLANAPIKDVRIIIQMKNGSGKFRIDDVEVYVTGGGLLTLPGNLRGQ